MIKKGRNVLHTSAPLLGGRVQNLPAIHPRSQIPASHPALHPNMEVPVKKRQNKISQSIKRLFFYLKSDLISQGHFHKELLIIFAK